MPSTTIGTSSWRFIKYHIRKALSCPNFRSDLPASVSYGSPFSTRLHNGMPDMADLRKAIALPDAVTAVLVPFVLLWADPSLQSSRGRAVDKYLKVFVGNHRSSLQVLVAASATQAAGPSA